jgi:acyl carrier protein
MRPNKNIMKTMNTILSDQATEKVRDILIEQLGVPRDQITPDARIMADLGADSLDMVEIGMTVEEAFNLIISDEEMEKVETVGDLYEALANLLERTGQPC